MKPQTLNIPFTLIKLCDRGLLPSDPKDVSDTFRKGQTPHPGP